MMTRRRGLLVTIGIALLLIATGITDSSAADAAPGKGSVVVVDGFGPDDAYNTTGLRSATTPPYGNPPATHALAQRITTPTGKNRLQLEDLDIALGSSTLSRAVVSVTSDDPTGNIYTAQGLGVPDESATIYSRTVYVGAQQAVYRLGPTAKAKSGITLMPGKNYWIVVIAPDPASSVAWFAAYEEHPQVVAERDSVYREGIWYANQVTGGMAVRVTVG